MLNGVLVEYGHGLMFLIGKAMCRERGGFIGKAICNLCVYEEGRASPWLVLVRGATAIPNLCTRRRLHFQLRAYSPGLSVLLLLFFRFSSSH